MVHKGIGTTYDKVSYVHIKYSGSWPSCFPTAHRAHEARGLISVSPHRSETESRAGGGLRRAPAAGALSKSQVRVVEASRSHPARINKPVIVCLVSTVRLHGTGGCAAEMSIGREREHARDHLL